MHALAIALNWAAGVAAFEPNPPEVEHLASELIELSTHHNFYIGERLEPSFAVGRAAHLIIRWKVFHGSSRE